MLRESLFYHCLSLAQLLDLRVEDFEGFMDFADGIVSFESKETMPSAKSNSGRLAWESGRCALIP